MRIEETTKNQPLAKAPKSRTSWVAIISIFAWCPLLLLPIIIGTSAFANNNKSFGGVAGATGSSVQRKNLVELAVDIDGEEMPNTEWPNLVGMPGQQAKDIIERENTELTLVVIIPDGSPVTADYREDRVRIFVDEHGKVSQIPRIG